MKDFRIFGILLGLFLIPAAVAFRRAKFELKLDERISTVTFTAAVFAYSALAIGVALSSWLHVWPVSIVEWISQTFGLASVLVGAIVYLTARLQLWSFRQTWALRTDKLLTSGIYRLLRHPQNSGWGFLLAGVALLGRSGAALILTGAYVVTCFVWLPVEDAFLQRRFGSSYSRYRRSTPALIPRAERRKNS